MSTILAIDEADRRLPAGEEIFLDHVAHFVPDVEGARAALVRAGFAPTPVSIQVNPDPAGGPPQPTGTGNITCMLEQGYLEVLFRTADTPLGRAFDAAMARYVGLHLAAFAVVDAAATHARLADAGFHMQPLVDMRRPVATESGEDVAAFSVVRLMPGEMPEGRIQALTHRTPDTVWQPRWLTHRNGARALIDIVIAVADPDEAAGRFARFLRREAADTRCGPALRLDRGGVQLVTPAAVGELVPRLAVPALPFMAAYGLLVASLDQVGGCLRAGELAFDRDGASIIAPFPEELGAGCWVFVEDPAALPWRR